MHDSGKKSGPPAGQGIRDSGGDGPGRGGGGGAGAACGAGRQGELPGDICRRALAKRIPGGPLRGGRGLEPGGRVPYGRVHRPAGGGAAGIRQLLETGDIRSRPLPQRQPHPWRRGGCGRGDCPVFRPAAGAAGGCGVHGDRGKRAYCLQRSACGSLRRRLPDAGGGAG